jgi:hypothetical protein
MTEEGETFDFFFGLIMFIKCLRSKKWKKALLYTTDFETAEEHEAQVHRAAGDLRKFGSRDPRLGKKGGVVEDSKPQVCILCDFEPA